MAGDFSWLFFIRFLNKPFHKDTRDVCIVIQWPIKPLVKRSGRLTYVRPGYRVTKRISNIMAYPLFPRSRGSDRVPPPQGGGGGEERWLRQAPAPFLLWSSQNHPPTLGSRNSASLVGVYRVSRWSVTGGKLSTYFRLCSFPLPSRQPCIRGCLGTAGSIGPAPFTRWPRVCP
jgi:hypothetical protein